MGDAEPVPKRASAAAASYPSLGAFPEEGGVRFRVWAPKAARVELVLEPAAAGAGRHQAGAHEIDTHQPDAHQPDAHQSDTPGGATQAMERDGEHFTARIMGIGPGARYRYLLDGDGPFPDPASRFQPEGVHGPSEVIDPTAYAWSDAAWQGVPQEELVFYELHVGTFTPAGTFAAAGERLDDLVDLGVTAVEIMPVHDFPGRWNWGYDPASYFAPARAYGRPDDLRAFVDAAHGKGLAVFLDVVYNHLGPDGSYLPAFSDTVFSDRHDTLWGDALNFDEPGSEGLRRFFVENALHWLDSYHIDGFRLDATFAIVDDGEPHFLAELAQAVAALPGRKRPVIAEDPRNLRALVLPPAEGGMGLDGVWADDFHHQVRSALAGDDHGYYQDFTGAAEDIAATIRQGWFYTGQRSAHQGAPRGTPADDLPRERFVYAISNHDQVGNRAQGERLHHDVSKASYRAASALLLFLPQLPLLFMGQEWAASSPFLYFTDHNEELGRLVSEGRAKEFADFPFEDVPDPQDPTTFVRSKLDWSEREAPAHARMLRWYRDLLARRTRLDGQVDVVEVVAGGLALHRGRHRLLVALKGDVDLPRPDGMQVRLSSEDPAYAAAPQPAQIGGQTDTAPTGPVPMDPVPMDTVRFWRSGALLWEAT